MNNQLSKEDLHMLYWHATSKMRQGQFHGASQFFNYVYEADPSFHTGLALAYCLYRNHNATLAKTILQQINPTNPREEKFYERLLQRVERVERAVQ